MRIRTRPLAALALGLAAALALPPAAALASPSDPATLPAPHPATEDIGDQLRAVKHATARYHDVSNAKEDGYQPASACVPGMGYHFARSVAKGQKELEPTEPNILVYAPQRDGGLKLVAVEYASAAPATLFGRAFDPPGTVPYYTLHAWVWERNPHGLFTAENPRIHCEPGAAGD